MGTEEADQGCPGELSVMVEMSYTCTGMVASGPMRLCSTYKVTDTAEEMDVQSYI